MDAAARPQTHPGPQPLERNAIEIADGAAVAGYGQLQAGQGGKVGDVVNRAFD